MAADYTLTIDQGATLTETLSLYDPTGNPLDLTGYTARAMVRKGRYGDDPPLLSLTSPVDDGLGIEIGSGYVRLCVPAVTTDALDFDRGVWDLELESGSGQVTRIAGGVCILDRSVTRG